ncbi:MULTISPECIES: hypothetical protein [unclassified Coleofasciculus]|nr:MULTISPECIES: hypothetical protein [unclassified Coleofasciculus]
MDRDWEAIAPKNTSANFRQSSTETYRLTKPITQPWLSSNKKPGIAPGN